MIIMEVIALQVSVLVVALLGLFMFTCQLFLLCIDLLFKLLILIGSISLGPPRILSRVHFFLKFSMSNFFLCI